MSLPVSPQFQAAADASVNDVTFGLLVAWDKVYESTAGFMTIGVSAIEGDDFIKGAGEDVTFFDKYRFQEETPHVNEISISRMSSVTPYGVFSAQADIQLDNTDKRYIPGFDPDIGAFVNKNRRPVKISAGFDGENVQQFVGFSDRPRTSLMGQKLTMHAYDVIDFFTNVETPVKAYEDYYFHEIIEDILLELGFSSTQFDLEVSLQQAPGFVTMSGMTVAQVFRKICEAEQGVIFADEQGIIHFWNRQHYAGKGFDGPSEEFDYTNLIDLEWSDTPVTNWVIVEAKPRAIAAMQPVFQLANSVEIKAGQTATIPTQFEDEDGPLHVTSVMDPVYIADRDDLNRSFYETNESQDGTGAPGNAFITMTDISLVGDVAFVEFSNTAPYSVYITGMEIHGTPAKVTDRISVESKDVDSIEKYGINPESNNGEPIVITNDWIQDAATARSLAAGLVDEYADPDQQLAGTVFGDPSHQYGDVVTVQVEDLGEDPRFAVVVGSELKMSGGEVLGQKLVFEYREAILFQQFFTIESSAIGGLDAIAP